MIRETSLFRMWAVGFAAMLGCSGPPEDPSLVAAFAAAADTTVGTQLPVDRIVPAEWDTLWLFEPYSVQPTGVNAHPAVGAARRTSVVGDERAHAVVVMSRRRVVSYAEVPRHLVEFDLGEAGHVALPRGGAVLTVCMDTSTERRVLAVNAAQAGPRVVCDFAANP